MRRARRRDSSRGANPPGQASSELRRPELVFPYSRRPGDPRRRGDTDAGLGYDPPGQHANGRRAGRSQDRAERWGPVDVLLLVYAALRIMLPYTLFILGGAAAAYGIFMLLFG